MAHLTSGQSNQHWKKVSEQDYSASTRSRPSSAGSLGAAVVVAIPPADVELTKTDSPDPVVAESREMIRAGSKSFAGAARLLSRGTRESVYQLYAWCRYCDDCIDLQDLGRGAPTAEVSEAHANFILNVDGATAARFQLQEAEVRALKDLAEDVVGKMAGRVEAWIHEREPFSEKPELEPG